MWRRWRERRGWPLAWSWRPGAQAPARGAGRGRDRGSRRPGGGALAFSRTRYSLDFGLQTCFWSQASLSPLNVVAQHRTATLEAEAQSADRVQSPFRNFLQQDIPGGLPPGGKPVAGPLPPLGTACRALLGSRSPERVSGAPPSPGNVPASGVRGRMQRPGWRLQEARSGRCGRGGVGWGWAGGAQALPPELARAGAQGETSPEAESLPGASAVRPGGQRWLRERPLLSVLGRAGQQGGPHAKLGAGAPWERRSDPEPGDLRQWGQQSWTPIQPHEIPVVSFSSQHWCRLGCLGFQGCPPCSHKLGA